MHKYIREKKFPADICLMAERLTKGRLLAVEMRPDLFKRNQAQMDLADQTVAEFPLSAQHGDFQVTIAVLNFFETQQPELYQEMMTQIEALGGGEEFIKQRMAHKRNEYN